ncbi:hypothetical protein HBI82_237800 [Parastagonospora nodorum]|nr:hypothetical protein HBI82_237800 [Parastagonospora nodorum]
MLLMQQCPSSERYTNLALLALRQTKPGTVLLLVTIFYDMNPSFTRLRPKPVVETEARTNKEMSKAAWQSMSKSSYFPEYKKTQFNEVLCKI